MVKYKFSPFIFNSVSNLKFLPKQLKYSFPSPPQVGCSVPLFWLLSVSHRWSLGCLPHLPCSCHLHGQWGSTVAHRPRTEVICASFTLAYKTSSVFFPLCRDFGGHMKILEHKVERVRIITSTLNETNREIIL